MSLQHYYNNHNYNNNNNYYYCCYYYKPHRPARGKYPLLHWQMALRQLAAVSKQTSPDPHWAPNDNFATTTPSQKTTTL